MAELIYDEMTLFAVCFAAGAGLALVYDGIRIFRLLFHHADWIVDVEDLLYWIFTGWMVFETLFYFNQGTLRMYAFIGLLLGVIFYLLTISRGILFVAEKLLPFWEKGKKWAKKPFQTIMNFVRKTLKNMVADVKMAIKSR